MKRLVLTGLPCPPEAWSDFLGNQSDQRILSMFEIFEKCPSPDLRQMSRVVEKVIQEDRPDSLICHGFGVTMALLALLRLRRRGYSYAPRLTLFNGALRNIHILKSRHPLSIQWRSSQSLKKEVERFGGMVDPRLQTHLKHIRAMYRLVILFNFAEAIGSQLQMQRFLGLHLGTPLASPIQLIASPNDPYIPYGSLLQLKRDFHIETFYEVEYGHFPYSLPKRKLVPLIERFERATF